MKKRNPLLRKKNVKLEARRRRLRRLGFVVLFLGLSVGIAWGGSRALSYLKLFSLKNIVILGNPKSLGQAELIQRAGVQLGTDLFRIKIQEVQSRLQGYSYFKSVSVQRSFPHTLVIDVKERFPELLLNTGHLYYVDSDGELFKDVTDTEDSRDMVSLSGFTEEMMVTEPKKSQEMIRAALELQKVFQASSVAVELGLSEIHYEKNIGFTLYPEKKKYSIKMGLKDFSEKIKKFEEIWDKVQKSTAQISSIDLNYPDKVLMSL